jgi:ferritin-like metal-binding protein YciE
MKLRPLSSLFLYELWTLCDAKMQVIAGLRRMSRLASNYRLVEELKAERNQAKQHMYLIRTIISSYQPIPPVKSSAIKGLITSSNLLFNRCGANAGAMDAALICASLDILYYELAKLASRRSWSPLGTQMQWDGGRRHSRCLPRLMRVQFLIHTEIIAFQGYLFAYVQAPNFLNDLLLGFREPLTL